LRSAEKAVETINTGKYEQIRARNITLAEAEYVSTQSLAVSSVLTMFIFS
jgi:hypothetical protein